MKPEHRHPRKPMNPKDNPEAPRRDEPKHEKPAPCPGESHHHFNHPQHAIPPTIIHYHYHYGSDCCQQTCNNKCGHHEKPHHHHPTPNYPTPETPNYPTAVPFQYSTNVPEMPEMRPTPVAPIVLENGYKFDRDH